MLAKKITDDTVKNDPTEGCLEGAIELFYT